MSAGTPNFQKVYDMGKLPDNMRHKIPGLLKFDTLQKELDKIKSLICKDCKAEVLKLSDSKEGIEQPKVTEPERKHIPNPVIEAEKKAEEERMAGEQKKQEEESGVKVRCPAHQCEYVAAGKSEAVARNNLRLHFKGKHPMQGELPKAEDK